MFIENVKSTFDIHGLEMGCDRELHMYFWESLIIIWTFN